MIRRLLVGFLFGLIAATSRCADRIPEPTDPRGPAVTVTSTPAAPVINVASPPAAVTVAPALPETDWRALLTQIGAGLAAVAAALVGLSKVLAGHRASVADETAWQDLVAWCYVQAGGDVPAALALIPAAYLERFGEAISPADLVGAKHGLAALQFSSGGLKEEDADVKDAKAKLAAALAKARGVVAAVILMALVWALPGCVVANRSQSLKDAETKMVERYEADHANQRATNAAYDAALLQAQTNLFTELHNERIRDIQNRVVAHPEDAADGIAAAADANLKLQAQIAAQNAAQAGIRSIVTQSEATNIVQARKLDAAIRQYDNTAPFNAAEAAKSVAGTVQGLIPPPTPITTKSAAKTVPKTPGEIVP